MAHHNDLWAITSYFNPAGYQRRLENYRQFRSHLPVPLLTVELSYGDRFELQPGDADILLQIRGRDVMWQKERLLNVALEGLPLSCSKVAWLDCDVILIGHWHEHAVGALDRFALVRLFGKSHYVADWSFEDLNKLADSECPALKPLAMSDLSLSGHRMPQYHKPVPKKPWGKAWLARRELLHLHGFYDACILGSGDMAMLFAACGCFDQVTDLLCMNERRREHYLAWAASFHQSIRGEVAYLESEIFHLWHGNIDNRRYWERHERLSSFQFDPYDDIALDDNGCWRWNSDKPEMQEYVRGYFASRREDG